MPGMNFHALLLVCSTLQALMSVIFIVGKIAIKMQLSLCWNEWKTLDSNTHNALDASLSCK